MSNPAPARPSSGFVSTDSAPNGTASAHDRGAVPTCEGAESALPHPEATFSTDWLALRAPADAAARAKNLTDRAAAWLRERRAAGKGCLVLTDLGTGCGANPIHLAPRLPGPQRWQLLDHDPALLARAHDAVVSLCDAEGLRVSARTRRIDLRDLGDEALAGTDLVCASAVLDLVDADWLARLAAACQHAGAALLVSLSVDGQWRFFDGSGPRDDPDDALVRERFNAHQRRDKGLGPALGPDAAPALAATLARHGYHVSIAPSPWQLSMSDTGDVALAASLLAGWRAAVLEQDPSLGQVVTAWHGRRRATLDDPRQRLEVGHLDLFAHPAVRGGAA